MHHVAQGKNQCGQACVAMITDMTLYISVLEIGKTGLTRTKDIAHGLRKHGWNCDDRLTRRSKKNPVPSRAIVKVKWPGTTRSHWVVVWDCVWHDPEKVDGEPMPNFDAVDNYGGHVTSFLRIWEKA